MDMNHIPDAAMTIATTALFAEGTTTIRNIYNWRVKETDRLHAMATELRKLGVEVEEARLHHRDPPAQLKHAAIDTYNDHRIAMCFPGGSPIRRSPSMIRVAPPRPSRTTSTSWPASVRPEPFRPASCGPFISAPAFFMPPSSIMQTCKVR